MTTILVLGFLIGMQHALEVDHVAAVASLATRGSTLADTARQGMVWGMGHTITLFLFGGAVILLDTMIPENLAQGLELAVGVMLVLLGADVLRRVIKERIHFHSHHHGEVTHFHAHTHDGGRAHAEDPHHHEHPAGFPMRSLMVGMMHGMAGSAALILLVLETITSPWLGLLYIALFGVGSILGMAMLAAVISLPLRYSARGLTWAHNGLKVLVGCVTVGVGGLLVYEIGITQGVLLF
ncbi:MAG: urease accessory protein [Candidatus Sedimenticola sp. 20ELBAFRAG]